LKKYIAAMVLLIVFLVIFVPLASSNPDGLEKVAQNFGANEQETMWTGLITDYSIPFIHNSYVSTLLAGIFGTTMVLIFAFLLGKILVPKKQSGKTP
jgi:hypothetical protein